MASQGSECVVGHLPVSSCECAPGQEFVFPDSSFTVHQWYTSGSPRHKVVHRKIFICILGMQWNEDGCDFPLFIESSCFIFQMGSELGVSNPQMNSMKTVLRIMALMMIPLTAQFPAVSRISPGRGELAIWVYTSQLRVAFPSEDYGPDDDPIKNTVCSCKQN